MPTAGKPISKRCGTMSSGARADAERVIALSTQHRLPHVACRGDCRLRLGARRLGDRETGLAERSETFATATALRRNEPAALSCRSCCAEPRPKQQDRMKPLSPVRSGTGESREDSDCWNDAESCIASRGEILLKCEPANTAPAEEAFLTAIAIAHNRRHGALSCARRWRSRTLSVDRPCRRHSRRAGTRARRLCADAGIPADRTSANAS